MSGFNPASLPTRATEVFEFRLDGVSYLTPVFRVPDDFKVGPGKPEDFEVFYQGVGVLELETKK